MPLLVNPGDLIGFVALRKPRIPFNSIANAVSRVLFKIEEKNLPISILYKSKGHFVGLFEVSTHDGFHLKSK